MGSHSPFAITSGHQFPIWHALWFAIHMHNADAPR